jgi:hypothetical protein
MMLMPPRTVGWPSACPVAALPRELGEDHAKVWDVCPAPSCPPGDFVCLSGPPHVPTTGGSEKPASCGSGDSIQPPRTGMRRSQTTPSNWWSTSARSARSVGAGARPHQSVAGRAPCASSSRLSTRKMNSSSVSTNGRLQAVSAISNCTSDANARAPVTNAAGSRPSASFSR